MPALLYDVLVTRVNSGALRSHRLPGSQSKDTCPQTLNASAHSAGTQSAHKSRVNRDRTDEEFPAPSDLPSPHAEDQAHARKLFIPFKRYRKPAQWLRVANALWEDVYDAAKVHGSHTRGTPANLLLQQRGFVAMQAPLYPPQYLRPSDQRRTKAPDNRQLSERQQRVVRALRFVDAGQHSRAMQELDSLGLCEVDEESVSTVRAMFRDTWKPGDPQGQRDFPPFVPPVTPESVAQRDAASTVLLPPAAVFESQSQAEVALMGVPQAAAPQAADASQEAAPQPPAAEAAPPDAPLPIPPLSSSPSGSVAELDTESIWSRVNLGRFLKERLQKASDFLGWNAATVLRLVQNVTPKAYAGLVDWFQLILEGALDQEGIVAELRRSRGHLLNKKGKSKIRAIGVVPWMMQIPSCIFMRSKKEEARRIIGPENVAVGVAGGSEAVVRVCQLHLEAHPDHVVFTSDCETAFPSVFRQALKDVAKKLFGLSANVELHLGGDNTIALVNMKTGAVHHVVIAEGGNTGCAKLPFLFTAAVQEALKEVRQRHPTVRIVGQMDDHTFLGKLAEVIAAYLDLKAVFADKLKLTMNDSKAFVVGGAAFQPTAEELDMLQELGVQRVAGAKISGAPVGTDDYVKSFLDERLGELDALATMLEDAAQDEKIDASWQSLFSLVKHCVATRYHFLVRVLLPSQVRSFAEAVDARLVRLALRVSGHWRAAAEDPSILDDVRLRDRMILLPSRWGGLGIPRLPVLAGFVGAAALIGPAVKGLDPSVDFNADTRYRRELEAALESLKEAINRPPPDATAESDEEPDSEPDGDADEIRVDDATLKSLTVDTIYSRARRKIQAVLASKQAAVEATAIRDALLRQGDKGRAAAARFVDRWQKGASAWLNATRLDPWQRLKNAHFRVAVGTLLGINCFAEVAAETPCPHCHDAVGADLVEHALRCRAAYTGDNNRRHQAMQQVLLYLLRLAGATVVTTPGVASFTAAEPKDASHAGRQLDLGVHALDDGPPIALDLCVSDCGTGKVSPNYKTGAKCVAKGKAKKKKYFARFTGIKEAELCCPSYGRTGSKNEDAVVLQKRINKALAAANPTTPYSQVAARVSQVISVALQRAVAYNALDFRYTKLAKGRVVGGGSGGSVMAQQMLAQLANDWDADDDEEPETQSPALAAAVAVAVAGAGVV